MLSDFEQGFAVCVDWGALFKEVLASVRVQGKLHVGLPFGP